MLQSRLFTKTSKTLPEGEALKNAQFLIKGGFIDKSSAGVYSLLPLGYRVLKKIDNIIREEMNAIGGEELFMPALVQRKYWQKSGRWDVEVIYKTGGSKENPEYGLGWTHEEVITAIATRFINSYKDLPKAVYQIQTKFRAEVRAQGGLLRGREFSMKDLYSFHASKGDLDDYYQKVISAYKKIFNRVGLDAIVTEASGGSFTKEYTHEFQVVNPAGEDTIFYCKKCGFSQNQEIYNASAHKDCGEEILSDKAIEVGNVFKLGTKFSDAYNLTYLDKTGERKKVIMGSYGIGPTRVLGAIVEAHNDDKGVVWPVSVAPFKLHILVLGESPKVRKEAGNLYKLAVGLVGESEVLYDDREVSAGEKFCDSDLFGVPVRLVVSEKTVAAKKIEYKERLAKTGKLLTSPQLKSLIKKLQ